MDFCREALRFEPEFRAALELDDTEPSCLPRDFVTQPSTDLSNRTEIRRPRRAFAVRDIRRIARRPCAHRGSPNTARARQGASKNRYSASKRRSYRSRVQRRRRMSGIVTAGWPSFEQAEHLGITSARQDERPHREPLKMAVQLVRPGHLAVNRSGIRADTAGLVFTSRAMSGFTKSTNRPVIGAESNCVLCPHASSKTCRTSVSHVGFRPTRPFVPARASRRARALDGQSSGPSASDVGGVVDTQQPYPSPITPDCRPAVAVGRRVR